MQRDFKGIWIPKEIWLSKELKTLEKVMLAEIDSLDNEDGCFASNKYFADFFDLSPNRVSEIIKNLKTKNFISIKYQYEGKQITKRIIRVFEKSNRGIRKTEGEYSETRPGYSENSEDNNTTNNTKIKYAEFVLMKESEYKTLLNKYGEFQTKRMIEILDNFKGANGKKYKDDYRAILSWVVDKVGAKPVGDKPKDQYRKVD